MNPYRIQTEYDLQAMVALDTVDLLAERVTRLLSHGRRITIARRYATWTQQPPEVMTGMVVNGDPQRWTENGGAGFHVRLTDCDGSPSAGFGMGGFGFSAYASDGNETEALAWKGFHAGEAHHEDYFKRRRNVTLVEITGGLPDGGPGSKDRLVILTWNSDGVCDEVVVAFEPVTS